MSPEYGATCGFFPIDETTLDYLRLSGREKQDVALVEAYAKIQGLWHDPQAEPVYTDLVTLDLSTIQACSAGPKRPQNHVELSNLANSFDKFLAENKRSEEKEKSFSTDTNDEWRAMKISESDTYAWPLNSTSTIF